MIAFVDLPALLGRHWVDRIEFDHADAALPETFEESLWRAESAHAVVDEIDLHSRRLPLQQQIRKLATGLVVLEYVGFEIDVVARLTYGGEHGGVRRGPVLQQNRPVSDHERAADDCLLDRDVLLKNVDGAN